MNRLIIFFICLIFLGIAISSLYIHPTARAILGYPAEDLTPVIFLSYENFEQEVSKNQIVADLPENALILLRFYNFNTGERQWEKSFIVKKNYVKEIAEPIQADITFSMSSDYLNQLTNKNFCEVIRLADANRDLGVETKLSKMSLALKYRNIMKYKNCVGL